MRGVVPVTTEARSLAAQETAREPMPEPCAASMNGATAAASTMRPWPPTSPACTKRAAPRPLPAWPLSPSGSR